MHYVDTHFRTVAGRAGRAIGGLSSGAYCALNLGLRHLAEFSTILAFEPYGTPGMPVLGPLLHGNMAAYRVNSPSVYMPEMRFTQPVAAFFDAGGAAPGEISRVRQLARALAARGQDVVFRTEPDQTHTWKEAAAGLPYGIVFAAHHLTGGLATLPATGRHIRTVGQAPRGETDPFARRYAAQVARCRRLGPDYVPVGGPTSNRCARHKGPGSLRCALDRIPRTDVARRLPGADGHDRAVGPAWQLLYVTAPGLAHGEMEDRRACLIPRFIPDGLSRRAGWPI